MVASPLGLAEGRGAPAEDSTCRPRTSRRSSYGWRDAFVIGANAVVDDVVGALTGSLPGAILGTVEAKKCGRAKLDVHPPSTYWKDGDAA